MAADSYHRVVYIPDENSRSGVYAYDPGGKPLERNGRRRFGENAVFAEDAEGIVIYAHAVGGKDTGEGVIVVADQRQDATELELFDRVSWAHRAVVRIKGVSNTDGIASIQQPFPGFRQGLLAVVDNDTSVVLVGWHTIFAATGLTFGSREGK